MEFYNMSFSDKSDKDHTVIVTAWNGKTETVLHVELIDGIVQGDCRIMLNDDGKLSADLDQSDLLDFKFIHLCNAVESYYIEKLGATLC